MSLLPSVTSSHLQLSLSAILSICSCQTFLSPLEFLHPTVLTDFLQRNPFSEHHIGEKISNSSFRLKHIYIYSYSSSIVGFMRIWTMGFENPVGPFTEEQGLRNSRGILSNVESTDAVNPSGRQSPLSSSLN